MEFKTIMHWDDPDFLEAIELYREAFPPEEQQPLSCLQGRLSSDQGKFLIARDKGKVLALAVLYDLSDNAFTLLEYFAVHESCRGNGLGSAFLKHLHQNARTRNRSLLAEVEDPQLGSNPRQRQKRIKFYERNGFSTIEGLKSYVPAQNGDQHTQIVLMIQPIGKRDLFFREEMEQLVRGIFREIYKLPLPHPLVQEVISRIPDKCRLAQSE